MKIDQNMTLLYLLLLLLLLLLLFLFCSAGGLLATYINKHPDMNIYRFERSVWIDLKGTRTEDLMGNPSKHLHND